MFLENNYSKKDTFVHDLNPLIKFIIFLSIVFLLFLSIPISIQLFLLSFVALIVWKSDCKGVVQKSIVLYFVLIAFLFFVNFVFMKTPGFWLKGFVNSLYKDILGIVEFRQDSSNSSDVDYGWYFGGSILKNNSNQIWLGDDYLCVQKLIDDAKYTCNHAHNADINISKFANLSDSRKWNFISLLDQNKSVKYVAFSSVWYTISLIQIIKAISLANKITLIIILSSVFTSTVSLSSFTYALEDLFRPLKILRFPTEVMALVSAISIRFAPSLLVEAFRIIRAQTSRGIDYKNGNFRDKVIALLSLFVPLFVISFIKARELADAMTARGYNTDHPRSSFKIHIVNMWELLVLFVSMFFISCLYYFFMNGYYFGIFSNLEYLSAIAS